MRRQPPDKCWNGLKADINVPQRLPRFRLMLEGPPKRDIHRHSITTLHHCMVPTEVAREGANSTAPRNRCPSSEERRGLGLGIRLANYGFISASFTGS